MTADEDNEWLQWVKLSSVPLKQLGHDDIPIGMASGCFVTYQGRKFILTASHAVKLNSSGWVIELGPDNRRGTEFYRVARFYYLSGINRESGQIVEVDFTFAEIPADLESTFYLLTPFGAMSARQSRHVFDLEAVRNPDIGERYAFTGEIKPSTGSSGLVTQPVIYPGLRYVENTGSYHRFILPVPHPGHDDFRGCSGASIVDTKRNLVGLVSGGIIDSNSILGIALSGCKWAVDFYCKDIRPA
ncbi:MAG: hypothetical protein Q8N04_00680 [Nitrospira sp.]|nr:hypothetical protein [Nitrospira sp.]